VDQIDEARERAEDAERREREQDGLRIDEGRARPALSEQQSREDDEVLGPLRGPQGQEEAHRRRTRRHARGLGVPQVTRSLGLGWFLDGWYVSVRHAELPRGGPDATYLKLLSASFSVSYVSNTVNSFVIARRS